MVLDDPLLDAGGLVAVSETGWPPEGYDLGLPEVGMYLPVHGLLGFEDDGNWLMEQALEFEMDQYAAEYGEGFDDDDFDD